MKFDDLIGKPRKSTTEANMPIDAQVPDLQKRISEVENVLLHVHKITKEIKYDDTATDIVSRVRQLAEQAGIDAEEFNYLANHVAEVESQLQSAVYNLDDAFNELLYSLKNQLGDIEDDANPAFNEGKLQQLARKLGRRLDPRLSKPHVNMHGHAAELVGTRMSSPLNDPETVKQGKHLARYGKKLQKFANPELYDYKRNQYMRKGTDDEA
jgi:DNA repair ATPase RecN